MSSEDLVGEPRSTPWIWMAVVGVAFLLGCCSANVPAPYIAMKHSGLKVVGVSV